MPTRVFGRNRDLEMGGCRGRANEELLAKYCQNNQVREDKMDGWFIMPTRGIHRRFR
jgi:hypothetical protein